MSIKSLVIIALFLFPLAACAPQSAVVQMSSDMNDLRENVKTTRARVQELQRTLEQDQKRIDALDTSSRGGSDVEKAMADYGVKTDQLTTDIQLVQGKLEENNFRIDELGQKLDDRGVKIAELNARVEELEAKVKLLGGGTGSVATSQTATASAGNKQVSQKTIEPTDAYRQAKSDYDKGNFTLALAGFQNYVAQFPDTSQTDKAQYWVGECYYSLKDFNKAIAAFSKVVTNYPKSEKVAGAKLKIGLSYLNERNPAKAREYLYKVIKEHPGTNEAAIAKDRLAKIGK
ncbi:MAG TPA: tol-pal system protein YbgF [Nitrospirota bacterium]|nr:tol-pal system protein YbgF [Nitrospirota bacterium]